MDRTATLPDGVFLRQRFPCVEPFVSRRELGRLMGVAAAYERTANHTQMKLV
jgi:hypothetical protein